MAGDINAPQSAGALVLGEVELAYEGDQHSQRLPLGLERMDRLVSGIRDRAHAGRTGGRRAVPQQPRPAWGQRRDHVAAVVVDAVVDAAGHASQLDDAVVSTVWEGIRRTHRAPPEQSLPIMPPLLWAILEATPIRLGNTDASLGGLRDHVLLLVGFIGALRRSELGGIDVETPRSPRQRPRPPYPDVEDEPDR